MLRDRRDADNALSAVTPTLAFSRRGNQIRERRVVGDQVEDPALAKGIVKREVVRVITPGTLIEDSLLTPKDNNYLMALATDRSDPGGTLSDIPSKLGLAFIDISTGEFTTTQLEGGKDIVTKFTTELTRFKPSECIVSMTLFESGNKLLELL